MYPGFVLNVFLFYIFSALLKGLTKVFFMEDFSVCLGFLRSSKVPFTIVRLMIRKIIHFES